MRRFASLTAAALVLGSVAYAQDSPKAELTGYYSYFRFNPENSGTLNSHSLNGGGGEIAFFFNKIIGIKAEFTGYQSQDLTYTNVGSSARASANLFTYNVGPVFKVRKKVEPFFEALFGGAHSSFYANLCRQLATCVVNNPSNNAFDFVVGGGLDVPIGRHFAIRPVQADYVLTRFGNGFTKGNQNQSNFRYQGGIQFRFGGGTPPPPPNRSPVASCSASPTQVISGSGDTVMVRADATDPDNDPLNYMWSATGGTIEGTGPQVHWNLAGVALGTYAVTARVDDGRGGSTSCSADVTVAPRPNHPPTMRCSASPSSVHAGERVHISASASDPDNDPLTFNWRADGGNVVGSGAEVDLDTTGLAAARYTVIGEVNDGRGGSANCRADVTVQPPAVEAKLAIRSIYFPTALPLPSKPDAGLVESQQKTLTSLANDFKEYLTNRPNAHLVLEGHADHRGAPDYNKALSERRVEITKRFLLGLGIAEANLETKAYGEEENMTQDQVKQLVEQHPNLTQEQRDKILSKLPVVTLAQNRRVDITLSSTGQQSVRQFPFNAEDALTLLSPKEGGAKPAAKKKP
jgi:OmpA family/Outer membrane protein beta-barrel domain